jgi:ribonuclease R
MLIAHAMIMANCKVAEHLFKNGIAIPNRFHKAPRGGKVPIITNNPVVDAFLVIKEFTTAVYDPTSAGHFGLGLSQYVHFTSPMRRYADIVVHMILAGADFAKEDLEKEVVTLNCRATFVRSLQRYYTRVKTDRWLLSRGEERHDVVVTSVAAAGVQWFMPSLLLNGFCHVSNFEPKQYWKFIDQKLVGASNENGGGLIEIGMGNKLNSKVKEININEQFKFDSDD